MVAAMSLLLVLQLVLKVLLMPKLHSRVTDGHSAVQYLRTLCTINHKVAQPLAKDNREHAVKDRHTSSVPPSWYALTKIQNLRSSHQHPQPLQVYNVHINAHINP